MRKHSISALLPRVLIAVVALLSSWNVAKAQHEVVVKSNLLYDAAATINLGAEIPLAQKWSFDLSGNFISWKINDHSWRHWMIQPEGRYWFCERFSGHFVAAHLLGGQFNIGNLDLPDFLGNDFGRLKDTRVQGWYVGIGAGYGYTWILSRHWSLEAEFAFGWAYSRYDRYPCATCGRKIESNKPHNYVGPTKVALNIVYEF